MSATTRVAPVARPNPGRAASCVAWLALTVLLLVSWMLVAFPIPVVLALSSTLAALSATTRVAPKASEKPILAARLVAVAAVVVLMPVS